MEIEGRKIVKVRTMSIKEQLAEHWSSDQLNPVIVLELDNGAKIFPSRDYEGNGGGVLFGVDAQKNTFTIVDPEDNGLQPADTSHLSNEEFGNYIKNNCK
jgi:hypothetical protein